MVGSFQADIGVDLNPHLSNCVKCVMKKLDIEKADLIQQFEDKKTLITESINGQPIQCQVSKVGMKNVNADQVNCIQQKLNSEANNFNKYLSQCQKDRAPSCVMPVPKNSGKAPVGDLNKKGIESPLISLIHGEDRRIAIRAFL